MNISRILCVDDDAPMQAALKTGLGMHGFEVITASHGIDALWEGTETGRWLLFELPPGLPLATIFANIA